MGFFKKDVNQEKEFNFMDQLKVEAKNCEKNTYKKKELTLFDSDTIDYIIANFPEMSIEIKSGLNKLAETLEKTINYIEDKSSEVIKNNRDFKVSKAHRDTSIAIYEAVQNIDKYVTWMQYEYEKNMHNQDSELKDYINDEINLLIDDSKINIDLGNEIEVYKDFSSKKPKAFKLDDNLIMVEDWEDLLVKTAEVLTKQYKESKNSDKIIKEIKPLGRKSTQNSFRDTIIDMLSEYKINFDEFKIVV